VFGLKRLLSDSLFTIHGVQCSIAFGRESARKSFFEGSWQPCRKRGCIVFESEEDCAQLRDPVSNVSEMFWRVFCSSPYAILRTATWSILF